MIRRTPDWWALLDETAIDRRAPITGRLLKADRVVTPPAGEIASILLQARPERHFGVEAAIVALDGCEIYGRDPSASSWSWSMPPMQARRERRSTPLRCCPTSIPPRSSFTPSTQADIRSRENRHFPSSVRENGIPACSSSITMGTACRHKYSMAASLRIDI